MPTHRRGVVPLNTEPLTGRIRTGSVGAAGHGSGSLLLLHTRKQRRKRVAHGAGMAGPPVEILVRTRIVLEMVVLHVIPDIDFRDPGSTSVSPDGGSVTPVVRRQVLVSARCCGCGWCGFRRAMRAATASSTAASSSSPRPRSHDRCSCCSVVWNVEMASFI